MPIGILRHKNKGLRLPGTSGNYASTPDSVLNSITGDIDIRVCVKMTDWSSGVFQSLVSKYNTGGNQRSYRFYVNTTGGLGFAWSLDGTSVGVVTDTSSGVVSFVDGGVGWVRFTLDVDNGLGQNDGKFYTSIDGITWAQLGITRTNTGVTSIFDSTGSVLEMGAHTSGVSDILNGTIYYSEVRNGIDGPVVVKFDSSQVQVSGAMLPASINGWTWNGSALYKRDDYVRLPGTTGNYLSFPDTPANSVTGDIDIRVQVSADDWTRGVDQTMLGKLTTVGNQRAYRFYIDAGNNFIVSLSPDGITSYAKASWPASSMPVADGVPYWIRMTYQPNVAGQNVAKIYTAPDGVTWTLRSTGTDVGSVGVQPIADTTALLEVGSHSTGTASPWAGNVYYAEVRNGINGPVVASFSAADNAVQTPWTINGTGWNWEGSSFTGKPVTALQLPGTSGNYVSTPDTAGNSVTGDLDIRVKVSLDDWTPAAVNIFLAKEQSASQRSYRFNISSVGALGLVLSADGSAAVGVTSTVVVGFSDGSINWLRTTYRQSDLRVQFFTSTDGVTWTLLGADRTATGIASIFDSTSVIEIGSRFGNTEMLAGKVYYAEVRKGIDGPIVAKFDPTNIARTGVRTPTITVQPGGTPNLLTPNQASIETDVSGWVAVNGAPTLSQDATQFLDGTKSLKIVATSAIVQLSARTGPASTVPVVPGKLYTCTLSARKAAVELSNGQATIYWYTAAGGFVSAVTATGVALSNAAWTALSVSAVAPATAALGTAVFQTSTNLPIIGDTFYVDRVSLVEAEEVWTINGAAWDHVNVPQPATRGRVLEFV